MRVIDAILISLVVALGYVEATSKSPEETPKAEAPFETEMAVMTCDSLDEATKVVNLSQSLSESVQFIDVGAAIEEVNSETGQNSCQFGELRYKDVAELDPIAGDSGTTLFRVFKFSGVTSFKMSPDENGTYDWAAMLYGPAERYVIVPVYGLVI